MWIPSAHPQFSLQGGWVNRPAPEAHLIRGMPTEPQAFLGNAGRVWAAALRPDPPKKKGLVLHLPVRCGVQQILRLTTSRTQDDYYRNALWSGKIV